MCYRKLGYALYAINALKWDNVISETAVTASVPGINPVRETEVIRKKARWGSAECLENADYICRKCLLFVNKVWILPYRKQEFQPQWYKLASTIRWLNNIYGIVSNYTLKKYFLIWFTCILLLNRHIVYIERSHSNKIKKKTMAILNLNHQIFSSINEFFLKLHICQLKSALSSAYYSVFKCILIFFYCYD